MSISGTDIAVIRKSWALAMQSNILIADLFYSRLFKIAPDTKHLFAADRRAQEKKLIATLGFIIENLHELDVVSDAASALAIRHVSYGVTADQYAPVGEALLWALEQLLGNRFGPAEAAAWTKAYALLSSVMIAAAGEHVRTDRDQQGSSALTYTKV